MPGSVSLNLDVSSVQIPHYFRCPISLELMRDPVTVATGQTYDRPSIESWAAQGHATCPVTRLPLPPNFPLTPNHTLRRLIQDWCVSHRYLGIERIPTPKQPLSPSSVQSLLSQSSAGDLAALRRLNSLARESDKNRRLIVSTPDARSALISIAFSRLHPSPVSAEALSLLALLPLTETESHLITSDPDRLSYLGALVSSYTRSSESRTNAAAVLEAVTSASRSVETRADIGATDGVMEGLVMLLADEVRVGIRGLFALCLAKENRIRAVSAGAAAAVMTRMEEIRDVELLVKALATVELLCRVEKERAAVRAVEGAAGILVRAMAAGKERAAEHAAGALVAVVGNSVERAEEAAAAGAVAQLLLMVQGGCSDRARRKGQLLLKMLRPAWAHYETVANSDDYYYFQQL